MNTATSKFSPAARFCSSAWLDTSITAARHPDSTITPSVRETSIAGGVVSDDGATSFPSSTCTVEIIPHRRPSPFSSRCARYVIVVFPLVPVTPISASLDDGSP